MIEIVMKSPLITNPVIMRFSSTGGYTRAFGGGKSLYEKGTHYPVPITSKHPFNILTEEIYDD